MKIKNNLNSVRYKSKREETEDKIELNMATFISIAPVLYSNAFDNFSRVSDAFTKKERCKASVRADAQ
jgi:hypothetical protein